jgi:hypothetical protein
MPPENPLLKTELVAVTVPTRAGGTDQKLASIVLSSGDETPPCGGSAFGDTVAALSAQELNSGRFALCRSYEPFENTTVNEVPDPESPSEPQIRTWLILSGSSTTANISKSLPPAVASAQR